MAVELIQRFGISLALTLAIELAAALVYGIRGLARLGIVALVNVLTNPAAVFLAWTVQEHFPSVSFFAVQLPIELAVILSEGLIYRDFDRNTHLRFPRPFLLSLLANGISWGTGAVLSWI